MADSKLTPQAWPGFRRRPTVNQSGFQPAPPALPPVLEELRRRQILRAAESRRSATG